MTDLRMPPYLPFLDGPARVAPLLKPIPPEDWLLPDTEAESWLDQKRTLMRTRRSEVFFQAEWAQDAGQIAADQVLAEFSPTSDFIQPDPDHETPLEFASSLVSDDLCVMVECDGIYHLGAATLCAPTFWSLKEKAGLPLGGLHDPVPGGDPQLAARISRVFMGLQEGIILERFNWTIQLGDERFTPSSAPMKKRLASMSSVDAALDLYFRVERQTIRKLPDGSTVLFTIRVSVDPLLPILFNPDHRNAFMASWKGTEPLLADYKGWPHYQAALSEALILS